MAAKNEDRILIVEDDASINRFLEHFLLKEGYAVSTAFNGQEGLDRFAEDKPDLIISDVRMPLMDGFDLCRHIKSKEESRLIPVILLTSMQDNKSKKNGIEAGADDFINKPVNRYLLKARINSLIKTKKLNEKLDNSWSLLFSLAKIIEAKDNYTERHTLRVAQLAQRFGEALGLSEEEKDMLTRGGVLHDVGKIGVPDKILGKKGRLTDLEFETMKSHTVIGKDICVNLNSMQDVMDIVYGHHEKYNGQGYPQGLRGDEIPLLAQIVSISDVYDALQSDRSYRKAFSQEAALEIIKDERGKSFKPELVDVFIQDVLHVVKA